MVAEHISPPLSEAIKIILKLSQGLHAAIMPYLFSSLVAHQKNVQAGFDLIRNLLKKGNLDLTQASLNDGAGEAAYFTPSFMTKYLEYMKTQSYYQVLLQALPILGKDGTLYDIQVSSQAAGHVFAKTGTIVENDSLNNGQIVTAKGLVGYMTTKKGHHISFAFYISNALFMSKDANTAAQIVSQALGELATSAYETF